MEVIGYDTPTKWSDKGMNWNTPDPTNADYVMAIRQALMERCAALHTSVNGDVLRVSPWQPVSRKTVEAFVEQIESIAGRFVNIEWEDFKDDWSDFPKMWTYADLVKERNCRLYEYAKCGSLCMNGGDWLKQIRNAIDHLTVIVPEQVYGESISRSGAIHDPPFNQSIGDAMQQAMEKASVSRYAGRFPSSAYAWSGNTHWCWPMPKDEGDDGGGGDGEEDENNRNGYCGYAQSQSYRIKAVRNWLLGAKPAVFAAVLTEKPTGPVPYSQQLDTSIFDSGGTGFRLGMNWTDPIHPRDPFDFEMLIGNPDEIPKNSTVPSSEYDDRGNAIKRHSTKRGWTGRIWGFLDYGVEGGFGFR